MGRHKGTDVFLGREATLIGLAVVIHVTLKVADGYRPSIGVWCRALCPSTAIEKPSQSGFTSGSDVD